jgi:hypothetical protein
LFRSVVCFHFFAIMPKQYLAEIGIHPNKLAAFQQGSGVTITADDLHGGSLFHAHFSKLKHLNEYKRNLSNGKTWRMTRAKISDIVDPQGGGSILGSISKGLSSVGKALSSKPAIDTYKTIGTNVASDVASAALLGAGIAADAKKVGRRIVNSSAGKQLGKMAVEHGAKLLSKHTGSEAVGNVARQAGHAVLNGKSLKGVARDVIRSEPARSLGRAVVRAGANEVERRTGSRELGNVAQSVGQAGLKRATGGGILDDIRRVGRTAGKAFPINPFSAGEYVGEHYVGPAIISSMKGGSLGGSLGGDFGVGGRRVSFHDGEPLWRYAARRQSGGSFKPL